jgi:hypothetical protein
MTILKQAAQAAQSLYASIFCPKKTKEVFDETARVVKDGIDVMEAASLNKDHKLLPASERKHLKHVFALAAACAGAGIIAPVVGTGVMVSLGSIALLECAKLLAYRGLRVIMPFDAKRMENPVPPTSFKDRAHNVLDFLEAVGLNQNHPWAKASDKTAFGKNFLIASGGIGIGMILTGATVGLPALAGVALTEVGKFAAYRGYRIMVPYRDGHAEPAPNTV